MFQNRLFLFIAGKAARLALLLAAVSIVSFLLVRSSPIDPIQAYVGADMIRLGPEQRAQIEANWGLDQPLWQQFWHWSSALLHGDLGTSMMYRMSVSEVIAERFAQSAALMGAAWLLSGLIGFAAGVLAGMNRDRWIDRLIRSSCYILASTPAFWLGLLLLMTFAVWLNWFPVGMGVPAGVLAEDVTVADRLRHMMLPALTLSIVGISGVALHTRQKVIDIMDSEYVLFARARGEQGFRLFWNHGLRNAAIPALTLQFASFSELFGGAVLAEQVFSYPGLGEAAVQSGLRGDVPLLLGIVLFSALFVFIGNTIADLIYKLVDPRMRERGRGGWA